MESFANDAEKIYLSVRNTFTDQGAVFLGGYATRLYSRYAPKKESQIVKKIPDFDVLSEEPDKLASLVLENLKEHGFKNGKIVEHEGIEDVIPPHLEIRLGRNETLAFIYKPIGCHSYNVLKLGDTNVKIATIDTMLNFYLAFYYSNKPYYPKDRILCMAKFLFDMENKNRLEQKGLLKRFSISCYGTQPTLESIRANKIKKFKELKDKKGTDEYDEWFLKYVYTEGSMNANKTKKSKQKKRKTRKKKNLLDYF